MTKYKVQKTKSRSSLSNYDYMLSRHPYLEEIIETDPNNPQMFICKVCTNQPTKNKMKEQIKGKFSWLRKHLETKTHKNFTPQIDIQKLEESIEALRRINIISAKEKEESKEDKEESQNISTLEDHPEVSSLSKDKEAEIYLNLAKFIIESHLPFDSAPKVLEFVKFIVSNYDEKLIQRTHTSPTTITQVIKQCFGSTFQTYLYQQLKGSPFSILLDGSSDLFGGKSMAVMVRYIDKSNSKLMTKLLQIVELGSITTGEALYQEIMTAIFDKDPFLRRTFISICTDNEAKMISSKDKGLSNRIIEEIPHVMHIRDISHCYNLVCEDALSGFPLYILEFIKKVCSYFNAGNRRTRLKEIQQEGVKEPLQILRYVEIR